MNRRNFINKIGVVTAVGSSLKLTSSCNNQEDSPFFIATWRNENAVKTALESYQSNLNLLSAVENGINYVENDANDRSVGLGGRPDRNGHVTLDACIMNSDGQAGAVCYVQGIRNLISLARDVMEKTPHVLLAGNGAQEFALSQGYSIENLLTPESKKNYETWLIESQYKPIINIENHDTIGLLGLGEGKLVGGCSTSGLAYKMAGRVGDSPIIGAGLYLDPAIGSCVATGLGEKVMTSLSSFLVVELMRNGKSPTEACKEALQRILAKEKGKPDFQVGLIAIDKGGRHGGYSIFNGFNYAYASENEQKVIETDHFYTNVNKE